MPDDMPDDINIADVNMANIVNMPNIVDLLENMNALNNMNCNQHEPVTPATKVQECH